MNTLIGTLILIAGFAILYGIGRLMGELSIHYPKLKNGFFDFKRTNNISENLLQGLMIVAIGILIFLILIISSLIGSSIN